MYWQSRPGSKRPAYLDLCLQTIQKHNPDFEIDVLDRDSLRQTVDCHPLFDRLSLNHQSDYARTKLLHEHGGMYLDFDTICLQSLEPWFLECEQHDAEVCGISWDRDGYILSVGCMGPFKARTDFTTCWASELDLKLESRKDELAQGIDSFDWLDIGGSHMMSILEKFVAEKRVTVYTKNGEETWGQFTVGKFCSGYPLHFFGFEDKNRIKLYRKALPQSMNDTEILMLNNALYPDSFKQLNADEVLQGNTFISQLLRKALSIQPSFAISVNQFIGNLNYLYLSQWDQWETRIRYFYKYPGRLLPELQAKLFFPSDGKNNS